MKITKTSQFQLGEKYYYADCSSPNLEHQNDCVYVMEVTYKDITKEYKEKYGFDPEPGQLLKQTALIYNEGRNPERSIGSTLGLEWIGSRNFYTTIEEACQDAICIAFTNYRPFGTK